MAKLKSTADACFSNLASSAARKNGLPEQPRVMKIDLSIYLDPDIFMKIYHIPSANCNAQMV